MHGVSIAILPPNEPPSASAVCVGIKSAIPMTTAVSATESCLRWCDRLCMYNQYILEKRAVYCE